MAAFELLIDFYKDTVRQGPGSPDDTLKALSFLNFQGDEPLRIADIGCGTGGQTLTLARQLNGHIMAVDLFPEFLEKLNERAKENGWQDRITTLERSMEDLPFESESLDLIWSEGAIYNMGFEAGIKNWSGFLKPGGYLAVSEITWLTGQRPREIEEYWMAEYPQIDTASGKIRKLEENGFIPVGYFTLPVSSWEEHYYQPIEERYEAFLERHAHSASALSLIEEYEEEIRLYRAFQDYYSYGFYIAKKDPFSG